MEFFRNLGSNIVMLMPQVIAGLKVTLEIFAITLILSIPLGIITAMGRRSKIRIINKKIIIQWILRNQILHHQLCHGQKRIVDVFDFVQSFFQRRQAQL